MNARQRLSFVYVLGLALVYGLAARAADVRTPDPEFPCQAEKSNAVTYSVDFSVVVTPPIGNKDPAGLVARTTERFNPRGDGKQAEFIPDGS